MLTCLAQLLSRFWWDSQAQPWLGHTPSMPGRSEVTLPNDEENSTAPIRDPPPAYIPFARMFYRPPQPNWPPPSETALTPLEPGTTWPTYPWVECQTSDELMKAQRLSAWYMMPETYEQLLRCLKRRMAQFPGDSFWPQIYRLAEKVRDHRCTQVGAGEEYLANLKAFSEKVLAWEEKRGAWTKKGRPAHVKIPLGPVEGWRFDNDRNFPKEQKLAPARLFADGIEPDCTASTVVWPIPPDSPNGSIAGECIETEIWVPLS